MSIDPKIALLIEARGIIAKLLDDIRSPFPGEAVVIASLGVGNSSIERGVAFLRKGWDEKSQKAIDETYGPAVLSGEAK